MHTDLAGAPVAFHHHMADTASGASPCHEAHDPWLRHQLLKALRMLRICSMSVDWQVAAQVDAAMPTCGRPPGGGPLAEGAVKRCAALKGSCRE